MFLPEDLEIRPFRPHDQGETLRMITSILAEDRQTELKHQIKSLFLHPALWVFSGLLISVIGISLDSPPVPTSIVILVLVMTVAKYRFQIYWGKIKYLFDAKSPDLLNIHQGYRKEDSFFLVATHRQRIVGTAAVVQKEPKILELQRLFVHPACRRMGIATKLIQQCQTRSIRRWGKNLILNAVTTSTQIAPAKCLGEAGFRVCCDIIVASVYPLEFKTVIVAMPLAPTENGLNK